MPRIASLEAFERAAARFEITELELTIEPSAGAAVRRSLDQSGLLLLGELHGVRENPLIIRALMQAFGLSGLALEWPADLTGVISAFVAGGMLADHPLLWLGDGRITAGHLAVLRERARAGPLDLALFDGITGADWDGSQQDEAMAEPDPGQRDGSIGHAGSRGQRAYVTGPASRGTPLGACLSRQRPGVLDIRISYGRGGYYNMRPSHSIRARASGQAKSAFTRTTEASYSNCPRRPRQSSRTVPAHGRSSRHRRAAWPAGQGRTTAGSASPAQPDRGDDSQGALPPRK